MVKQSTIKTPTGQVASEAMSREDFISFLVETLIPDLRASGSDGMADDFEMAVDFMRAPKQAGIKNVYSVDKMYILPDAGALCAFADVCVNGAMIIRGTRVLNGKKGMFVSAPKEQGKDSKWYDQVVFKTAEEFEAFSDVVLAHYNKQKEAVHA